MPFRKSDIPPDVEVSESIEAFSQLTGRQWSCIILDVADRLAPMIGGRAMELYYRVAMEREAEATDWEGYGEAWARRYIEEKYVKWSYNQANQVIAHVNEALRPISGYRIPVLRYSSIRYPTQASPAVYFPRPPEPVSEAELAEIEAMAP